MHQRLAERASLGSFGQSAKESMVEGGAACAGPKDCSLSRVSLLCPNDTLKT